MIKLLFFGRLSDYSDQAPSQVALGENTATPEMVRRSLCHHDALYKELNQPQVLVAVNHEISEWNRPLQTGDEVAFLPPVTGG